MEPFLYILNIKVMTLIIGIDEVGRGSWAGPLVVGAIGLGGDIAGLRDSKVLSASKRRSLARLIEKQAVFIGLGWVTAGEVDDLGLTKATMLACERAVDKAPKEAKFLIDGKINYLPKFQQVQTVIDGDATEISISAASIVAKVARDQYMAEQELVFPGYSFSKNVGYGTKQHLDAIKSLGLTPLHRWSYKPIQEILNNYEA